MKHLDRVHGRITSITEATEAELYRLERAFWTRYFEVNYEI